jgi:MFS family permease
MSEGGDGAWGVGRRTFAFLLGAFGFFGIFWGSFAVLLADLSDALSLSPGPLGAALFVGAASSIVAMATLGWTADRLGRRPFLLLSAAGVGLGIGGLALADGVVLFVGVLVVLYAASGLYDIGINACAVDLERAAGRHIMSPVHAAFSFGGVVGALGSGALLQIGVNYRIVYLLVLAPLAVVVLGALSTPLPASGDGTPGDGKGGRILDLLRGPTLLVVAVIATLGLLSEGEMEHWSGIYLRQTLGLPALLGGSGVAVFYGAMAVGRLCATLVIERLGNRKTLLYAGALTACGMLLALATREPILVVVGFLVVGLALSAVAPLAFSAAGYAAPDRAGAAISVVTTLGYGGFLLGPVIVGGLAEVFGLRTALLTIAAAGLLILTLGARLPKG